jgi:phage/plasmid primase-like uncharacterized protein
MFYSSYAEQIQSHIQFLRTYGLDTNSLEFGKFIRCHAIGENQGRGKYTYICNAKRMGDGNLLGLISWCRGKSGEEGSFKTYGPVSDNVGSIPLTPFVQENPNVISEKHTIAARKAYGIWKNSSFYGRSDYLLRKQVGSYGIRFNSFEQYGNVAIVPMRDENGYLWCCQVLNSDGSKRMTSGARTKGLFHKLCTCIDGNPIGIAESYVTAATCFELSGISTICCFSANNMPSVALSVRKLYSQSQIVLFADNDRHLEIKLKSNKGTSMALGSIRAVGEGVCMVCPEFDDLEPSKDASDWNDLVRFRGIEFAKTQMHKMLKIKSDQFLK